MATSALEKFDFVIERSDQLLDLSSALAEDESQQGEVQNDELPNDLIRMAIILAVAGMDAYFTEKFSDILIPYLKRGPLTQELELFLEAGFGIKESLAMLKMQRPHRRIRTLVDAHLEKLTTQRAEAIDKLFGNVGLKKFCQNAAKKAYAPGSPKKIAKLVERRHEIAHEADLNTQGAPQKIDLNKVKRQIRALKQFVHGADAIATNFVSNL
jgi:hypothetical protein